MTNLIFNDGSERQVIENFSKKFPDVRVSVFSAAFIVKSIDLKELESVKLE